MKMLYAICIPHLTCASDVIQNSVGQLQFVAYYCPFLYSSYPIRVALSLSRFPLRFALTYPRRLSCPLPRPLICQPLVESLVVTYLVDRVLSLAVS